MTIGVEFSNRLLVINDDKVMAQIWDTGGQDKYSSVTNMLAILVFSLSLHTYSFLGFIVELLVLCLSMTLQRGRHLKTAVDG